MAVEGLKDGEEIVLTAIDLEKAMRKIREKKWQWRTYETLDRICKYT